MSGDPCVLAIDHGTSGIKAALVRAGGEVVDSEFEKTPMNFIDGGGAEQDPNDWWRALIAASSRLVRRAAVAPEAIEAMCVSSTFSSTVAVDRNGDALMPSLTWMDSRGAPYVRRVVGGYPSIFGYNLLRCWRWVSKTGGAPSLSGKDDAAHALLVKHEFPQIYRQTHRFLPSKDYLNLQLTGEFAASYDSMQLFWVTDTRDPNDVHYDTGLIAMIGIDRDKLPPLRASTDVLGAVRPRVAEAIGLRPGVRVVVGSPDHQCALYGSGAVRDYEGHLYIGTSSWIECLVPFKKTDLLHSIACFPTSIPGKYQCVNEQDLAGGALGFLADNIVFRRNELLGISIPDARYELVDRIAASVPAGSDKLLFTPWLNGERTPVDDHHLRGAFHNISPRTTLDHMARAVLEGVAYNTRWSLGYVEKFLRRRLDPIRIIGGGARSALWCRIFADVLEREIHAVADPIHANARGAAFVAAIGLGWMRLEDIPSAVAVERTYRPDPRLRSIYDEMYDSFLRIHRANRRIYRRLNRTEPTAAGNPRR
ncbi:MAG: FGGY-family carbohydrate kinase [Deltaproteobacteria bacterium]|nr:FGGY-family carbohydrate kinase [Deltaproteobacteria bacterium]